MWSSNQIIVGVPNRVETLRAIWGTRLKLGCCGRRRCTDVDVCVVLAINALNCAKRLSASIGFQWNDIILKSAWLSLVVSDAADNIWLSTCSTRHEELKFEKDWDLESRNRTTMAEITPGHAAPFICWWQPEASHHALERCVPACPAFGYDCVNSVC